jgi:hypothetical protein
MLFFSSFSYFVYFYFYFFFPNFSHFSFSFSFSFSSSSTFSFLTLSLISTSTNPQQNLLGEKDSIESSRYRDLGWAKTGGGLAIWKKKSILVDGCIIALVSASEKSAKAKAKKSPSKADAGNDGGECVVFE